MERLTSYKSVCKREIMCRHEDCDTCEEYCPHINEDNCLCLQEVLEKLAEYEDLEEQGKLLKLDDKYQKLIIGQEVWITIGNNTVKQANISRISESWSDLYGFQGEYTAIPKTGRGGWDLKYDEFGKTVFLKREEAEAALKEL